MPKRPARNTATPAEPPHDGPVVERLRRHLEFLGLTHALRSIDETLAWAARERPGPVDALEHVLGLEVARKTELRITRRLDASGMREQKALETFDWNFQPTLDKGLVLELASLDFVRRHDDIVITGKSGTGKSHVLMAIARRACEHQLLVRYARCVDLLDDLYAALADGSYPRRLKSWARAELLVIDDVGLGQVKKRADEPTAAHILFNLIDMRHGRASTAVTSNVALSEWGRFLGDNTVAMAILDRLAMNAIRIDIDGPSYRQHVADERARSKVPRATKAR